jgi:hypothetical protein
MIKITTDELIANGYEIQNAKITCADLSMADHGFMVLQLVLDGKSWGTIFGGYTLGKGYLGADEFEGSAKGMESIMQIMNVVGVSKFNDLNDKYVRVATKGWGSIVHIIGNILDDNLWFDYDEFFKEGESND